MKTPQLPESNQSAEVQGNSTLIGRIPVQNNTVLAEILARLIVGERLTGMAGVFKCSTTRLAASIHSLESNYGWSIERTDLDVVTLDGRVAKVRSYWLSPDAKRAAINAGLWKFCQDVKKIRAELRTTAEAKKKLVAKRNAARFNPHQCALFDGGGFYG